MTTEEFLALILDMNVQVLRVGKYTEIVVQKHRFSVPRVLWDRGDLLSLNKIAGDIRKGLRD